jgi:hypothetical protein
MYVHLKDNKVWEFIPEEDPALPGVPLEERYPAEFIASLISVESTDGIDYGHSYDPQTGAFAEPPEEEYVDVEPALHHEPTQLDTIEAQVAYTAMITNTLLGV